MNTPGESAAKGDAAFYVGLDIGGTKFLVAGADGQGKILGRIQEATPPDVESGLNALNRMIAAVARGVSGGA